MKTVVVEKLQNAETTINITLPQSKWVGEDIIRIIFSLTSDAISNYRKRIWMQGVHFRRLSLTGNVSRRKAKIVYNLAEINKWIDSYPQY